MSIDAISIKCVKHPDCDGTILCLQCGFLCSKDSNDENNKKHKLLFVDYSIKELYESLYNQEKTCSHSSFINFLKKNIIAHLDQEVKENDTMRVIAQEKIKKCLSEYPSISAQTIKGIITQSIMSTHKKYLIINGREIRMLTDLISCYIKTKTLNEINDSEYKFASKINSLQKVQCNKSFINLPSIYLQFQCNMVFTNITSINQPIQFNKSTSIQPVQYIKQFCNMHSENIHFQHSRCNCSITNLTLTTIYSQYESCNRSFTNLHSINISSQPNAPQTHIQLQNMEINSSNILNCENNLENISSSFKTFNEDQWKAKYDQIMQKYNSQGPQIICSTIVLQNKTYKEGKT